MTNEVVVQTTINEVVVVKGPNEVVVAAVGLRGPPGPEGGVADTLPATAITYDGEYATVEDALNALLYVAPHINSLSNNVGTVEIGSTVTDVVVSWSLNKTVTSQTLTDTSPAPSDRSHDFSSVSLTSNKTYSLNVSDGSNSAGASTSVSFLPKRYFGASSNTSLTSAQIIALASEFATGLGKSLSYDCTGGKYPYYAYPSTFGNPASVTVGGLAFSDYTISTVSVTNASGYTQNYNVIRFGNIQTGSNIAVVFS